MKNILEMETAVNKELQFGRLIHQPIIAWALDMSRAQVEPVPVAVGDHAKFFKNSDGAAFQLVPANPGLFVMTYLAQRSRELLKRLTPEERAEMNRTAGAFVIGVWGPEDTTDWREVALGCERAIFEDLILPVVGAPIDRQEGAVGS